MKRVALLALVVLLACSIAFAGVRFKAQNQSLRLDGNGYLSISNADQIGLDLGTSDIIMGLVFKVSDVPNYAHFLSERVNDGDQYQFAFYNDGSIRFGCGTTNANRLWAFSPGGIDLRDGRWHVALATLDRSANAVLYIDGVAGTAVDFSTFDGVDISPGQTLYVMAYDASGNYNVKGLVGRVWFIRAGYAGLDVLKSHHNFSSVADLCADMAKKFYRDPYLRIEDFWPELEMVESFDTEKVLNGDFSSYSGTAPNVDFADWNEKESSGAADWDYDSVESAAKITIQQKSDLEHHIALTQSTYSRMTLGKMYVLKGQFKSDQAGDGRIGFNFRKQGGKTVVGSDNNITVNSSGWTDVELTFILPTDATLGYISIQVGKVDEYTAPYTIWAKNISLHPVGCIADWFGDPSVQGTYNDATVNGNDLTEQGTGNEFVYEDPLRVRAEGGTAKVRLVPFHKSLRLDGNGYAEISDADQVGIVPGAGDFAFLCIGRPSSLSTHRFMVDCRYPPNNRGWGFGLLSNGTAFWEIRDSSDNSLVLNPSDVFAVHRWHSFFGFVERAGAARLYHDGTQIRSESASEITDDVVGQALYAGRYGPSDQYSWVGFLSRLAIFNFGKNGLSTWASYHGLAVAEAESTFAARIYRRPYASLSELGFPELEMAESFDTEKVTNGGMENGDPPSNWTTYGTPPTFERSNAQAHEGTYSLHVITTSENHGGKQTLSLIPGKIYEITAWVYVVSGGARLWLSGTPGIDWTTSTGQWVKLYGTRVAPAPDSQVRILSYTGASEFYVDDVSIHPVGCVADWTFDNTYNDATVNANHLTEQGTGNQFVRIAPR